MGLKQKNMKSLTPSRGVPLDTLAETAPSIIRPSRRKNINLGASYDPLSPGQISTSAKLAVRSIRNRKYNAAANPTLIQEDTDTVSHGRIDKNNTSFNNETDLDGSLNTVHDGENNDDADKINSAEDNGIKKNRTGSNLKIQRRRSKRISDFLPTEVIQLTAEKKEPSLLNKEFVVAKIIFVLSARSSNPDTYTLTDPTCKLVLNSRRLVIHFNKTSKIIIPYNNIEVIKVPSLMTNKITSTLLLKLKSEINQSINGREYTINQLVIYFSKSWSMEKVFELEKLIGDVRILGFRPSETILYYSRYNFQPAKAESFYSSGEKTETSKSSLKPDFSSLDKRPRTPRTGSIVTYKNEDSEDEKANEQMIIENGATSMSDYIPDDEQIYFYPHLKYKFHDKKTFTITNDDFKCLYNGNWINDTLVDFFIEYKLKLAIEQNVPKAKNIEILNSFFFTSLSRPVDDKNYYKNVKSWFKMNNTLFDKDFLIIPIMQDLHWYFVVITDLRSLKRKHTKQQNSDRIGISVGADNSTNELSQEQETGAKVREKISKFSFDEDNMTIKDSTKKVNKYIGSYIEDSVLGSNNFGDSGILPDEVKVTGAAQICIVDSLRRNHEQAVVFLKHFLIGYAAEKYDFEIKTTEILKKVCLVPQQKNFNDCGVHVLFNVDTLLSDPVKFNKVILKRPTNRKYLIKARHENKLFFDSQKRLYLRDNLRTLLLNLLKEQVIRQGGDATKVGKVTVLEKKLHDSQASKFKDNTTDVSGSHSKNAQQSDKNKSAKSDVSSNFFTTDEGMDEVNNKRDEEINNSGAEHDDDIMITHVEHKEGAEDLEFSHTSLVTEEHKSPAINAIISTLGKGDTSRNFNTSVQKRNFDEDYAAPEISDFSDNSSSDNRVIRMDRNRVRRSPTSRVSSKKPVKKKLNSDSESEFENHEPNGTAPRRRRKPDRKAASKTKRNTLDSFEKNHRKTADRIKEETPENTSDRTFKVTSERLTRKKRGRPKNGSRVAGKRVTEAETYSNFEKSKNKDILSQDSYHGTSDEDSPIRLAESEEEIENFKNSRETSIVRNSSLGITPEIGQGVKSTDFSGEFKNHKNSGTSIDFPLAKHLAKNSDFEFSDKGDPIKHLPAKPKKDLKMVENEEERRNDQKPIQNIHDNSIGKIDSAGTVNDGISERFDPLNLKSYINTDERSQKKLDIQNIHGKEVDKKVGYKNLRLSTRLADHTRGLKLQNAISIDDDQKEFKDKEKVSVREFLNDNKNSVDISPIKISKTPDASTLVAESRHSKRNKAVTVELLKSSSSQNGSQYQHAKSKRKEIIADSLDKSKAAIPMAVTEKSTNESISVKYPRSTTERRRINTRSRDIELIKTDSYDDMPIILISSQPETISEINKPQKHELHANASDDLLATHRQLSTLNPTTKTTKENKLSENERVELVEGKKKLRASSVRSARRNYSEFKLDDNLDASNRSTYTRKRFKNDLADRTLRNASDKNDVTLIDSRKKFTRSTRNSPLLLEDQDNDVILLEASEGNRDDGDKNDNTHISKKFQNRSNGILNSQVASLFDEDLNAPVHRKPLNNSIRLESKSFKRTARQHTDLIDQNNELKSDLSEGRFLRSTTPVYLSISDEEPSPMYESDEYRG